MNIAVTAASGKLGTAIVHALLEIHPADKIVALARTPASAEHLGIEVRKGDYTKYDELEESLQGIDTVLLISGMDHPDLRIEQHRNVIRAAEQAGVRKVVYTSIQGAEENTAFSPVVQSNRQTEADLRTSELDWVIGRNGIYLEPDIDYIENYKRRGKIENCAGDGLCGYTTRPELGYAYARLLTQDRHNGHTYNLHGTAISQQQLADYMNEAFGTQLVYEPMSVEDYRDDRVSELGEFLGNVIAGIYEGIRLGKVNNKSDFLKAAGRPHKNWETVFSELKITVS